MTNHHHPTAPPELGTVVYLDDIPADPVPAGRIVAHNHVIPVTPLGLNGFRAWFDDAHGHYEPCDCGWARTRLAVHHRVRRPVEAR